MMGIQFTSFSKSISFIWLEAMSLIREVCKGIYMIDSLQALTNSDKSAISSFLRNAKGFTLQFRLIIEVAPLQLYSSALIFSPEMSIIRKAFTDNIPGWISSLSKVEDDWDACRSTLEGHSGSVNAVAFSRDGQLVAFGSYDNTVRLWDAATGSCRSTLEGHPGWVTAIAFLPDGQYLKAGKGQIPLSLPFSSTSSSQEKKLPTIFVKTQWISYKEQDLLWIPSEYRPSCSAVYRNVICIGHSLGHVTFLKFHPEKIGIIKFCILYSNYKIGPGRHCHYVLSK
ncbi:hypothetical protein K469DRAFT_783821 [Zopfia rhizophila CBS 207.26]|uniref:Uncharacterized protein n=1 Tax=Zopfia rhizophila CBS 207.26 TaxID=1314779 RepID=A0A6A6DZD7_9PEZI|nr:hypothetical protein K469DRAFT_783821 [Zopfia rhizophila CBS 207.26]